MAKVQTSRWRYLDLCLFPTSVTSLDTKSRQKLYMDNSKSFTIKSSIGGTNIANHEIIGLDLDKPVLDNEFAGTFTKQCASLWVLSSYMSMYFSPFLSMLAWIYLLYYHYYKSLIVYLIIFGLLVGYNHSIWREFVMKNPAFYNNLHYFSFKLGWNEDTAETLQRHDPKTCDSTYIMASIPHGVLPMATVFMPMVVPDITGHYSRGTSADIVFRVPFIRQLLMWAGAISVSKQSIMKHLKMGDIVHLVPDGIAGMFAQLEAAKTPKFSESGSSLSGKEIILLRNRKGVAKLALQSGSEVIVSYGFGNTLAFDAVFDKFGILKDLSRRLKMSLLWIYGKWYLPIPKRVPLYGVMGPIVPNPCRGKPIANPTTQQIDEYHSAILEQFQILFDQHKSIYGWDHKQISFV